MEIKHIEIPTLERNKEHYEKLTKKYGDIEEKETIKCPCGGEYIEKRRLCHEATRIHMDYVG